MRIREGCEFISNATAGREDLEAIIYLNLV
jgi:hypothetical protein